jgi:hypothetical protein
METFAKSGIMVPNCWGTLLNRGHPAFYRGKVCIAYQ